MFRLLFVSLLVGGPGLVSLVSADEVTRDSRVVENTLGMKFVRIEPGEFVMGSPESEEGHDEVETQHPVRITQPYYLGQHEVTIGQFRKFVAESSYKTELERDGKPGFGFDASTGAIEILPKFHWRQTGFEVNDRHPVTNVTWDDALAFCVWLIKKEGHEYRLPTEAQWEYACRAGTTARYSTGETEESLKPVANLADAAFLSQYADATWSVEWNDGHPFTAPVGSLQPNAWGLYDMHGNVWEWCADWYAADYYRRSPKNDPPGPATGDVHVLRGGAFTNRLRYLRSADRDSTRPKYRYNFTGFRVVRAIP